MRAGPSYVGSGRPVQAGAADRHGRPPRWPCAPMTGASFPMPNHWCGEPARAYTRRIQWAIPSFHRGSRFATDICQLSARRASMIAQTTSRLGCIGAWRIGRTPRVGLAINRAPRCGSIPDLTQRGAVRKGSRSTPGGSGGGAGPGSSERGRVFRDRGSDARAPSASAS